MASEPLEATVRVLLGRLGYGADSLGLDAIEAGGNNRVFRLDAAGKKFLVKWYFHSTRDQRDRLRSEFAFMEHARSLGLRCVPAPLACEPDLHVGLYEFVEGRRLASHEIDERRVLEAARFFADLNAADSRARAGKLPAASEACFSIAEHFAMVEGRLARFSGMRRASPADRDAAALIAELRAGWVRQRARIENEVADPRQPLHGGWRCLSPSDFGFHNALLRPGDTLCFLDFEYAGWDDPAKTFGDFFAHPGSPVAGQYRDAFLRAASAPFRDPAALVARARTLEPVFRIKWCCIILNEFLPDAAERRRFARPEADEEPAKAAQVQKAQRLFASLND